MSASGVEGRVGVSRRSGFGAPAGRYVEVEADLRFDGWLVRLFEADPRDGPGESTDVTAATEDDLSDLLGPEKLDVEWLTEPLPDDTLAEFLGDGVTGGYRRSRLRELVEAAADAAVTHMTDDR